MTAFYNVTPLSEFFIQPLGFLAVGIPVTSVASVHNLTYNLDGVCP